MNRFDDAPNGNHQDQGFRSDEVKGPYREAWARETPGAAPERTDSIGGASALGENQNPAWAGAQANLESETAGRGAYGTGEEGALGYGEYQGGGEMPSSPSKSESPAGPKARANAGEPESAKSDAASVPNEGFGTRHWGHGEYKGDDNAGAHGSKQHLIERAVEKVGRFFGIGPKGYARADGRVHEDVCECLQSHHEINAADVEVEVKNGVVKLTGTVDDRAMRRLTEDAIAKIPGIREVENHLGVANYVARTEEADQLKSGEVPPTLHS